MSATPASWDQGGAIADLDGDGRADLALVRKDGWGRRGIQYRIDFQLTAGRNRTSIRVSAEEGGLRIVARDVDADGDLDLVITSAKSFALVGVWINDGHGAFTEGDPAAYARTLFTEGPGILSNTGQASLQAAIVETFRYGAAFTVESYFCNALLSRRLSILLAANLPGVAVRQPQTRAPPSSLPQQPN
jgi:hypothetical protein